MKVIFEKRKDNSEFYYFKVEKIVYIDFEGLFELFHELGHLVQFVRFGTALQRRYYRERKEIEANAWRIGEQIAVAAGFEPEQLTITKAISERSYGLTWEEPKKPWYVHLPRKTAESLALVALTATASGYLALNVDDLDVD